MNWAHQILERRWRWYGPMQLQAGGYISRAGPIHPGGLLFLPDDVEGLLGWAADIMGRKYWEVLR